MQDHLLDEGNRLLDNSTETHQGNHHHSNGSSKNTVVIPRDSFTAFRLRYSSPAEISRFSASVSLGSIPRPWIIEHTTKLREILHNNAKARDPFATSTVHSRLHSLTNYIGRSRADSDNVTTGGFDADMFQLSDDSSDDDQASQGPTILDAEVIRSNNGNDTSLRRTTSRASSLTSFTRLKTSKAKKQKKDSDANNDTHSVSQMSIRSVGSFSHLKKMNSVRPKNALGWTTQTIHNFQNEFNDWLNEDDEDEEEADSEENSDESEVDNESNELTNQSEDLLTGIYNAKRETVIHTKHSQLETLNSSQRSDSSFITADESLKSGDENDDLRTGESDVLKLSQTGNLQLPSDGDSTLQNSDSGTGGRTVITNDDQNAMDPLQKLEKQDNQASSNLSGKRVPMIEINENAKRFVSFVKYDQEKDNNHSNHTSQKDKLNFKERRRLRKIQKKKLKSSNPLSIAYPVPDENLQEDQDLVNDEIDSLANGNFIERRVYSVIENLDKGVTNGNIQNVHKYFRGKRQFLQNRLNNDISKVEKKLKIKRMLKKRDAGEIIQIDKMLVKVIRSDKIVEEDQVDSRKTIKKMKNKSKKNKDKGTKSAYKNNKVLEKWREFIVVVRSTGNVDHPILMQFFNNREIKKEYDKSYLQWLFSSSSSSSPAESDNENGNPDIDEEDGEGNDTANPAIEHDIQNLNAMSKLAKKKMTRKYTKNCEFEIIIGLHDTEVKLFNSLDKSIQIIKSKYSYRNETKVKVKENQYLLLCQKHSSAIKWLSFFSCILNSSNRQLSRTLSVNIPDLNVLLSVNRIDIMKKTNQFMDNHSNGVLENDLVLRYTRDGYVVPRTNIFDRLIDVIVQSINKSSIHKLISRNNESNHPNFKRFLHDLRNNKSFLAFALKQYDRLEWILGDSENLLQSVWTLLNVSHDLELRAMRHEPSHLVSRDMVEPLPIEGFLVKLTNRQGKLTTTFGRNYYKIRYFFTCNHLLMFTDFFNGVPSFDTNVNDVFSASGEILDHDKFEQILQNRPEVFEKNIYTLASDGRHIDWLHPGISKEEFIEKDLQCTNEAERRVYNLSRATRIINLTEVQSITAVPASQVSNIVKSAMIFTWGVNGKSVKDEKIFDSCFQIVLKDGTTYRFQACNREIRDNWISRLEELAAYWIFKKKEELVSMIKLKEANISISHDLDDYQQSLIANESSSLGKKWETSRAVSDPTIYNISAYAMIKPIIMSGILYQKHRKHKNFRQYYAILCPGYLILYNMFDRSKFSHTVKYNSYYKYYTSIKLDGSYVYCDKLTSLELIDKDKSFNHNINPGGKSIPRLYLDGWQTSEDESVKYFTVWFGSKRVMLSDKNKNNGDDSDEEDSETDEEDIETDTDTDDEEAFRRRAKKNKDKSVKIVGAKRKYLKTVSRLGVTGNSQVFMARSRQERDLWVHRLNIEIERFSNTENEEVKFV